MSSVGRVASSSECATRPKAREIGSTGSAVPTQRSLSIGRYVMAMAEHREPGAALVAQLHSYLAAIRLQQATQRST
jgi:hypothetical protein